MNREYQIRKIVETFDSTGILGHLVELIKSGENGPHICELLGKLSEHDVALAAINAKLNLQLIEGLSEFFSEQRDEYKDMLRIGKLFGFKKWGEIATEASMLAWRDTDIFIQKICQIREITERIIPGMRKELMKSYLKQMNHLLNEDQRDLSILG